MNVIYVKVLNYYYTYQFKYNLSYNLNNRNNLIRVFETSIYLECLSVGYSENLFYICPFLWKLSTKLTKIDKKTKIVLLI